jgi:hypothetical protein
MQKLTRVLVLVMLLATIIMRPGPAFACSCMVPGPPEEALEQAAVVFAGRLVDTQRSQAGGVVNTADLNAYRFEVSRVWKGDVTSTFTIGSAMSSASCGYEFVIGEEYIVYGFEQEGIVQTGLCTRTAPLAGADEDLTALGEGQLPAPGDDPTLVDPQPGSPANPEAEGEDGAPARLLAGIPTWAWVVAPILLAGAVLAIPMMRRRR